MIHLTRYEFGVIAGVLLLLVAGFSISRCRQPHVEYVPGKVEAGWRVLQPEPLPAATPSAEGEPPNSLHSAGNGAP